MPEFAQFVAVTAADNPFRLPDPNTGDIDVTFPNIDLANLDQNRTAVALFKIAGQGFVTLRMRFNSGNDHIVDFLSTPDATRTWHEVFPGSDLRASNNELTISVERVNVLGSGSVMLSDIVIFYHARIP
jgi:hypothetical protein